MARKRVPHLLERDRHSLRILAKGTRLFALGCGVAGLPTPDGLAFGFGFFSGQRVSQSETAHGGSSGFESKAAQQFRSDGAVRAAMLEQVACGGFDFLGPGRTTIAAGEAGIPAVSFALGYGFKIRMIQLVETARAQVQFGRPFQCFDVARAKAREDVTNEWRAEAL
ncbi:MAG TPA: hypothetical protein VK615_13100 [Candidatus Binatia bacterium]|nr:hypothetical protein [Candidatus Binatia bacterium]